MIPTVRLDREWLNRVPHCGPVAREGKTKKTTKRLGSRHYGETYLEDDGWNNSVESRMILTTATDVNVR